MKTVEEHERQYHGGEVAAGIICGLLASFFFLLFIPAMIQCWKEWAIELTRIFGG